MNTDFTPNQTKAKQAKRVLASALATLLCLASAGCGVIEMREADRDETQIAYEELLTPAAHSEDEDAPTETESAPVFVLDPVEEEEEEISGATFVFAGDMLMDSYIITDAAKKAGDGQSYSFLRLFTGVYQELSSADLTTGFGSTVQRPRWDIDPTHVTPEEFLATLSEVGYDALDTLSWRDADGKLAGYDIADLSTALSYKDCIRYFEVNDITAALYAVGGQKHKIGAQKTFATITEASENALLTVVLVDWDEDMTDADKCAAAYYMAEAGADVVIGTGTTLGAIDRLRTERGSYTLVAYSLGDLLLTTASKEELCGGILRFKAEEEDGALVLSDVTLTPTVTHIGQGKADYQIFPLSAYNDDLATQNAAVSGLTAAGLVSYVRSVVPGEFLPKDIRG